MNRRIDILVELPFGQYQLAIPREIEFEVEPAPEELRSFILREMARCDIQVRSYFGFFADQHPGTEQRVGGWDEGYWASKREIEFIESQRNRLGKTKKAKSKLFPKEADIALAARSLDSIVLSLDPKRGPLRDAYLKKGFVVFLNKFPNAGTSLADYIGEYRKGQLAGLPPQ